MYSLWERIKSGIAEFVQSRIFVLIIVFCITSAILVQRIFYLQIVKGQEYLDDYKLQIQKTKEIQGTRGNIYDRNGNLLAIMNWHTLSQLKTMVLMTVLHSRIKF